MGTGKPRNSRGVNSAVSLCLAQFTAKLSHTLDVDGAFTGPGAVELSRMGYRTAAKRFAVDYLFKELFSKYDDGKPSSAKRAKAVERFNAAEVSCALVNQKLAPSAIGQEPWWMDLDATDSTEDLQVLGVVLRLARKHISRALGSFPGWSAVFDNANFGPGSSTRLPRSRGHHAYKWANCSHVTEPASSHLRSFLESIPGFAFALMGGGQSHQVVVGNKLDWVPKNYKTDRTIAIEPDWNMFFQKGVGSLIRRKLKRVGIDLDSQEANQLCAFIGSVDGSLATIDLSMASDCVAYRLAEFLIRPDWFEALDALRSPVGFYTEDGVDNCVVFEKLSSMGNGFTFEVETLIFWGIARAVSELCDSGDHRLLVYGDDIVVPTGISDEVCRILGQVGFATNADKTFSQGPFRESCGAHWFEGDDVTPFYVREPVDTIDRLFLLHNNVARWLQKHPGICSADDAVDLLNWIRQHAPKDWRKPRLLNLDQGDGGFYGSFTQVRPRKPGVLKYGWDGWISDVLLYRSRHVGPALSAKQRRELKKAARKSKKGKPGKPRTIPWPRLTNPDFASMWRRERESLARRVVIGYWPWPKVNLVREPAYLDALKGLERSAESEVPYRDRFWSLGTLVTPTHQIASVWWDWASGSEPSLD